MLLAASPHLQDNPGTHDTLAALPTEVLGLPALSGQLMPPDAGFCPPCVDQANTPAHAIHTPQQLAQLEAIAQAQARDRSESATVSDEEKYLAAQVWSM
jgi:hypothetical protein